MWWADYHLAHGYKVVVHCRHGQHRTAVAISLLLRSIFDDPVQCLSMMKEMRPIMHAELLRETANRYLFHRAGRVSCRSDIDSYVRRSQYVNREQSCSHDDV